MKKIYALYVNKEKLEIKISSPKAMQDTLSVRTLEKAEREGEVIAYWNDLVFISYSRKALVLKGREMIEAMIKQKEEEIQKLKGVVLK